MAKFQDKYPEGKLDPSDEGVLDMRMGMRPDGNFMIDFGEPVHWLAMTREQAFQFAKTIMKHVVDRVVTVETPDADTHAET